MSRRHRVVKKKAKKISPEVAKFLLKKLVEKAREEKEKQIKVKEKPVLRKPLPSKIPSKTQVIERAVKKKETAKPLKGVALKKSRLKCSF